MISQSGMMCFLYNCFNSADKEIRIAIIVCMAIQVVINMVTVVQIIVQCGPNPYHAVCKATGVIPDKESPSTDISVKLTVKPS